MFIYENTINQIFFLRIFFLKIQENKNEYAEKTFVEEML